MYRASLYRSVLVDGLMSHVRVASESSNHTSLLPIYICFFGVSGVRTTPHTIENTVINFVQ